MIATLVDLFVLKAVFLKRVILVLIPTLDCWESNTSLFEDRLRFNLDFFFIGIVVLLFRDEWINAYNQKVKHCVIVILSNRPDLKTLQFDDSCDRCQLLFDILTINIIRLSLHNDSCRVLEQRHSNMKHNVAE